MDDSDTLFATLDTIKQVRAGYWRGFLTALAIAVILAWSLPDLVALAVPYVVGVWG